MMWVPTEMDSNFGEDTYETEEEGEEKKKNIDCNFRAFLNISL